MASFKDNNNGDKKPDKAELAESLPYGASWSQAKQIVEPRCFICQSVLRNQIERELLLGHGQATIAKKYQNEYNMPEITRKSVHTHAHKHMTIENAAIRRIIERRYQESNEDVAEAMGILLGQRSVLEILAYKGYKSALSGQTIVEVKDLLTILKDIRALEGGVADVEKEEMRRDFQYFTQAVKETVDPTLWERVADRFNQLIENSKPKLLDQLISPESLTELEIIGEAYEDDE